MSIDETTLKLIREHGFVAQLNPQNISGLVLWIVDAEDRVVDVTPAMAAYFNVHRSDLVGRLVQDFAPPATIEGLLEENAMIRRRGEPSLSNDWVHLPVGWRKFAITKTPLGREFILGVAHDITDTDPLAGWLQRLDLVKRRLGLGPRYREGYLTLSEFFVLHRLSRNHTYQEIADELHRSPETIKYRLNRIKEKLGVMSAHELWEEVYVSGLMHLLALPLDLAAVPRDEDELMDALRNNASRL